MLLIFFKAASSASHRHHLKPRIWAVCDKLITKNKKNRNYIDMINIYQRVKYSRNNIIRKDKRRKIKKQMVEFVSFLKSQDWLKSTPWTYMATTKYRYDHCGKIIFRTNMYISCNGNFIHQQSTFQFTVGNDNNNNNNIKNNTIDRHSTHDRLIDASLSSTSEESSVSRRVRHNIERGGRMESHVTNEIICSLQLLKIITIKIQQ